MNHETLFSNERVTEESLYELARTNALSRTGLAEALRFSGYHPDRKAWLRFIEIALLTLGAGLLVVGIFFFFAYNWNDLHRFAKLGIVQGLILVAAGFANYLGLDTLPGKIALTVASLLVGALMALFGQLYQSTADAYTLFLYWAIYIAAWVVIGRFAFLWLVLVGLLNLTLGLFWGQSGLPTNNRYEFESLFVLNVIALAAWEWFQRRGVPWMQLRWWARIVALAAVTIITIPAVEFILSTYSSNAYADSNVDAYAWLPLLLYLLFIPLSLLYYRYRRLDLMILTMLALSVIAGLTAAISRLVDFNELLTYFVLSIVVIVEAGLAAIWLRNVGEQAAGKQAKGEKAS